MSSFTSIGNKKNGYKAKPSSSSTEVEKTVETCVVLKEQVLPFADFGYKFRAINIFWTPLQIGGGGSTQSSSSLGSLKQIVDKDPSTADDDLLAARPPDALILSIWRRCHMGIILEAYSNDNGLQSAKLNLAIHLFDDGIHMTHVFGTASKKDVIRKLRSDYDEKHPVYSAGVQRDVHVDLNVLHEVVESFKTAAYNVAGFNCQHFATIVYYRFTGQFLRDALRRRWTSSHNGWGFCAEKNDRSAEEESMEWTAGSRLLKDELHPVEGGEFLFSRSPPGVGKLTKAAVAGGTLIASRSPFFGLVVGAGSIAVDKIPGIRRFSRSTVWYKYDVEKQDWFWTPYRDQEVPEDQRWISVHQFNVPTGRFEGKVLENTNKRIVSVLACNYFNPAENQKEVCHICIDPKPVQRFSRGPNCPQEHAICTDCFSQLDRCPFCRTSYNEST